MRLALAAFAVALLPGVARAQDLRGWIGAGGRNAIAPAYTDFGVYAMGGVWLLHEHVQPFARVGWSQGGGPSSSLDAVRAGAGVAFGGALARDRLWLGAAVAGEGMLVLAQDGSQSSWLGMVALSGLADVRVWKRLLVGVEAGVDFFPSPLRAPSGALEWDVARFNAGLRLGVILGRAVD